jgi:hypothetical protein
LSLSGNEMAGVRKHFGGCLEKVLRFSENRVLWFISF